MIFAEHSLTEILQIATNVAVIVIIPWVITVERRLSTLIALSLNKNGLSNAVENLQQESKDQRIELQRLQIQLAEIRGGQASDSAINHT